jgi:hypothetical protein
MEKRKGRANKRKRKEYLRLVIAFKGLWDL